MKKILTTLLIASCAQLASASGLSDLENFMKTVRAGRADFVQNVTAPAREGQAPRVTTSSGNFEFQRPGQFKFIYQKPFAQSIVADGKTLWLYDADLNQVTQREQSKAMGSTPAALLASSPDLQALKREFDLKEGATDTAGGADMAWVTATPKTLDGQLQSVQVGFAKGQLHTLRIKDSFGQQSVLTFNNFRVEPSLPASTFQFQTPKGADVSKQ